MKKQYLYFLAALGFNDILCCLNHIIEYCKHHNRIILFDTCNSLYKINFSDYFDLPHINIIYDFNKIINICKDESDIYPHFVKKKDLADIIAGNAIFEDTLGKISFNGKLLRLPDKTRPEKILFFSTGGGGDGYVIFKTLSFKQNVIRHVLTKYSQIIKPYLCIQIRNTDYKCNYQLLYEQNKDLVHSFNYIYIATDDINVLDYFRSKNLSIVNFTRFGTEQSVNLHENKSVNPDSKILDLITDIYFIMMADIFLSNSEGGFVNLAKSCRQMRPFISSKFIIEENITKKKLKDNKIHWLSDLVKIKS
jgi:hypothetical protein